MAISKRSYQLATEQPLALKDFSVQVELGLHGLGNERARVKPGEPKAELIRQAASALGATADDLAWLRIELPKNLYGPTPLIIRNAEKHAARSSVLVAELGQGLQLVPHR